MSTQIFISYGGVEDQVTALRLQALGVANGLKVYVPPIRTRSSMVFYPEGLQKLHQAEVILGIVGTSLTEACRQELATSLVVLHKPMIVVVHPESAHLLSNFGSDPIPVVSDLAHFSKLEALDASQAAKNVLFAMGAVALGLLLLDPRRA